jgi:hypothetical protein
MTSKLDDRFAERHPERSSRSVIRNGHRVASSKKWSSGTVIAKRHPSKKVNVFAVFFLKIICIKSLKCAIFAAQKASI